MKWSEQMRVLNSEDEHYNQLMYDVDENALYINDELIATLNEQKALEPNKFLDLKKKYPYIDDKNFLLNCLFKLQQENTDIRTRYFHPTYVEYPESEHVEGDYFISVSFVIEGTYYKFKLFKKKAITPLPAIS